MLQLILVIIVLLVILKILLIIKKDAKEIYQRVSLEEKIEKYERKISNLEMNNYFLKEQCDMLLSALFNTQRQQLKNNNKPTEIPKGTIDAVKLAMKVSHPDNGGSSEDFIKYQRCYKILTGKRR